jgi:DNA-binding MarR family transcriptional regulator
MTTPDLGPPPTPALGDPDQHCSSEELLDAWMDIISSYTRVNRMLADQVEQETGLPSADFLVLARLRRGGYPAAPLSALARELAFSSGGFTKLADRLQQAGLIERQPSPCDRRVINVVLTPAGRAAADQALAVLGARLRELVLSHVGIDGLRAIVSQMSQLSDLPPSRLEEQPEGDTTVRPG